MIAGIYSAFNQSSHSSWMLHATCRVMLQMIMGVIYFNHFHRLGRRTTDDGRQTFEMQFALNYVIHGILRRLSSVVPIIFPSSPKKPGNDHYASPAAIYTHPP